MKKSNLQLLRYDYFVSYKKKLKVDLKKSFAKIPEKHEENLQFDFYLASASTYSSNIEGNTLNFDTYLKYKEFGYLIKKKEAEEIDDLVDAYIFAQENEMSLRNILKAHSIYSKSFMSRKDDVGKLRKGMVGIRSGGQLIYLAIEPEFLKKELAIFFKEVEFLIQEKLSIEEIFYFASMIHLRFVNIHPFADGNGRATRLMEKWFLASKLGKKAWNIESEKNYFLNRNKYYKNLQLGGNYYVLNYNLSLPFLLLLPNSLVK